MKEKCCRSTMTIKEDQKRVRDLLREAITVLCKNGLKYKGKFVVEGLLGITLDDEDIFLVNINEKVSNFEASNSPIGQNAYEEPSKVPKRKKRGRRKSSEAPSPVVIEEDSNDASNSDFLSQSLPEETDTISHTDTQSSKAPDSNISSPMDSRVPPNLSFTTDNVATHDSLGSAIGLKSEVDPDPINIKTEPDLNEQKEQDMTWSVPETNSSGGSWDALNNTWPSVSSNTTTINWGQTQPVESPQQPKQIKEVPTLRIPKKMKAKVKRASMTFVSSIGKRRKGGVVGTGADSASCMVYMCQICGTIFKHSQAHRLHMNEHEGKYNYNCQYCGKGFRTRQDIDGHINHRHMNNKPYTCDICGKGFSYVQSFKLHKRRIHSK